MTSLTSSGVDPIRLDTELNIVTKFAWFKKVQRIFMACHSSGFDKQQIFQVEYQDQGLAGQFRISLIKYFGSLGQMAINSLGIKPDYHKKKLKLAQTSDVSLLNKSQNILSSMVRSFMQLETSKKIVTQMEIDHQRNIMYVLGFHIENDPNSSQLNASSSDQKEVRVPEGQSFIEVIKLGQVTSQFQKFAVITTNSLIKKIQLQS